MEIEKKKGKGDGSGEGRKGGKEGEERGTVEGGRTQTEEEVKEGRWKWWRE